MSKLKLLNNNKYIWLRAVNCKILNISINKISKLFFAK